MEIEYLIHALLSVLSSDSLKPLQRILSIDGGVELLTRVVSAAADPSKITLDDIREEKENIKLSSHYDW